MSMTLNPPDTLGKRIRRARMRRGWEQQELAKMIGVSRKTMNQIEQGKVDPRASLVVAIANVLQVSTDTLLVQYED
jgi:DNA-binding XRE family transcriptional regulator